MIEDVIRFIERYLFIAAILYSIIVLGTDLNNIKDGLLGELTSSELLKQVIRLTSASTMVIAGAILRVAVAIREGRQDPED